VPTYQYACTECGHELEAVQSFSDPALTQCPACEGRLRKVFSAVGIVFKGSGFYRTDSRGDKSAASVPAASKESTSSSDGGSSSTSSTPASSAGAEKSAAKPAASSPAPAKAAASTTA
jgi:putative FmdB family regulatory protein